MKKLLFKQLITEDGFRGLHTVNISVRCEHTVHLRRSSFKCIGDSQFFKVLIISSEEIMQFHDHGPFVFRFARGYNVASIIGLSPSVMAK